MSIVKYIVDPQTRRITPDNAILPVVQYDSRVDSLRFMVPADFSTVDLLSEATKRYITYTRPCEFNKNWHTSEITGTRSLDSSGSYFVFDWPLSDDPLLTSVDGDINIVLTFLGRDTSGKELRWNSLVAHIPVAATGDVSKITFGETPVVKVTGISLDKSTITVTDKSTGRIYLTAIVTPDNATNKTVKWTSSDTTIAIPDPDTYGTFWLPATKNGTSILTATTEDGGYTATCNLTVAVAST